MTCFASTDDSRTFHSSPSNSAVCERFDEPMNAVVRPDVALEQPRLRVQLRHPSVERDADLRAERDELVDGALLRRAHVGRRDDADAAAASHDAGERVAQAHARRSR